MKKVDREKYNMKQLNIEIPQVTITGIKVVSAMRNISIRTWVSRAIIKALNEESIEES